MMNIQEKTSSQLVIQYADGVHSNEKSRGSLLSGLYFLQLIGIVGVVLSFIPLLIPAPEINQKDLSNQAFCQPQQHNLGTSSDNTTVPLGTETSSSFAFNTRYFWGLVGIVGCGTVVLNSFRLIQLVSSPKNTNIAASESEDTFDEYGYTLTKNPAKLIREQRSVSGKKNLIEYSRSQVIGIRLNLYKIPRVIVNIESGENISIYGIRPSHQKFYESDLSKAIEVAEHTSQLLEMPWQLEIFDPNTKATKGWIFDGIQKQIIYQELGQVIQAYDFTEVQDFQIQTEIRESVDPGIDDWDETHLIIMVFNSYEGVLILSCLSQQEAELKAAYLRKYVLSN